MEWGIILGLVTVVLAAGAYNHLRGPKRRRSDRKAGNIYPLW